MSDVGSKLGHAADDVAAPDRSERAVGFQKMWSQRFQSHLLGNIRFAGPGSRASLHLEISRRRLTNPNQRKGLPNGVRQLARESANRRCKPPRRRAMTRSSQPHRLWVVDVACCSTTHSCRNESPP